MARAHRRAPRITPAAIFMAVVMALLAAPTAQAERSEFFGIVQGSLDDRDAQGMSAAHVRTARFLFRWRSMEPSPGAYDWRQRDGLIGRLASHHIRAVPFVWGSPEWVGNGKLAQPPIGSDADKQAWRNFLSAAVARYGPGGTYWSHGYVQRYGADAKPLAIRAWQVWNEPNLRKYFSPGENVQQSAQKYATLLRISNAAIESVSPRTRTVLAGMPSWGDSTAWTFLRNLYQIPGTKDDFEAAALHPYGCTVDRLRQGMEQFHAAMRAYDDDATPVWLTEVAWGSGPPDRFCKNKGPDGQSRLLSEAFRVLLNRREDWNVQRLFWFLWRDPEAGSKYASLCSICGTAGLQRHNRSPKPAFSTFRSFTAETTPPEARFTSGPASGSFTNDSTPTFTFASNEAGSTFQCAIDGNPMETCSSRFTLPQLSEGARTLSVKAIDAPGNESAVQTRSFNVDTTPPATTITSGPPEGSISSSRNASFSFDSSESDATFGCQLDSGGFDPCSSPYTASGLANGQHSFQVRATDRAGNVGSAAARSWSIGLMITTGPSSKSPTNDATPSFAFSSPDSGGFTCSIDADAPQGCTSPYASPSLADGSHTFRVQQGAATASRQFVVDTTVPGVAISSGPANDSATNDPTPTFRFSSTEPGSTFRCRYEGENFSPCSGASSDTAAPRLADGLQKFRVRAVDDAHNASEILLRTFTVDTVAPRVTIARQGKTSKRSRRARATFVLDASEQVSRRRCRVDSRPFKSCSRRYTTPRLTHGIHRLKVKATDRAGNVGAKRKRFRITTPRSGRTTSGDSLAPRCRGLAATLIGSPYDDRLIGTDGRDVIVAFAGNDRVRAGRGRDVICAHYGQDEVTAGPGADWVRGGPRTDELRGGPGHDTIRGGTGFDACGSDPHDLTLHC
jgi:putative glycosyl hydrolase/hemolysin type calcium-binding protein